MATENDSNKKVLPVAADYSSVQYYLMDENSSGQWVKASVAGQKVFGPLLDKPDTAGDYGTVALAGQSKVKCGGTVAYGAYLVSDASARGVTKTADNQYVFGRALQSGVVGDVIEFAFTQFLLSDTTDATMKESFGYGAAKGLAILQNDFTAYDATAGALNIMHLGSGNKIAALPIVGQTIPPAMVATGLDVQGDQVDNDGWEFIHGVLGLTGRPFVIGDDRAFYSSITFTPTLANGSDELHFGFRRAEALNATFDNYLDLASLGWNTAASPAAIKIETILNNGATTTTDTTDTTADATAVTFRVNVSAAGVVTYLINGVAPSVTAAFTFDDGDPVIPFFHFLQANAAQTGALVISDWTTDYQ